MSGEDAPPIAGPAAAPSSLAADEPSGNWLPGYPDQMREKLRSSAFHRRFHDIQIEPGPLSGWPAGPIWPVHEMRPKLEAHWVSGHITRGKPAPSAVPEETIEGQCVWAGALMPHFGHFVAEHCQRLLFSKLLFPDATFIFSAPRGTNLSDLPGFFWDICDWFEISRDQVRFVHDRPVMVKQLDVLRQGEQLQRVNLPFDVIRHRWSGPKPVYLRGLNQLQKRKNIPLAEEGIVYVSRAKLSPSTVRIPGEAYLEAKLQELGVEVVWPETIPLRAQIETYAKARTLIFAEGSSVHVRQFLGLLPQHVIILVRRKGLEFGRDYLESRCNRLTYIDAVKANLFFTTNDEGYATRHTCSGIINDRVLLRAFAAAGIDLESHWSREDYRRAHDQDLEDWVAESAERIAPAEFANCLRILSTSLMSAGEMRLLVRLKAAAERCAAPAGTRIETLEDLDRARDEDEDPFEP